MPSAAKPTASPRFYLIQLLRGVAAILVVLHHQHQAAGYDFPLYPVRRWMDNGAFGVDIFFPISGFVMYLSAIRPGIAWAQFAWRRFVRVAPLYYLFTALKLALFFLVPATMLHYRFVLSNAIASFFFLPAFNNQHVVEPPLVVGWTLDYEMFFYAIVTLALALRWPLLRFCAAILITLGILGLLVQNHNAIDFLASPIVLEFLAGMLVAVSLTSLHRVPWIAAAVVLAASLLCALSLPPGSVRLEFQPSRLLVWGIPGALVLGSVVILESRLALRPGSRTLARLHPLLLLGDASYMLYLTHTFVVPATHFCVRPLHLTGGLGFALWVGGGLAISLAVGVACHLYVELPLLRALEDRRPPWSARSAELPH